MSIKFRYLESPEETVPSHEADSINESDLDRMLESVKLTLLLKIEASLNPKLAGVKGSTLQDSLDICRDVDSLQAMVKKYGKFQS